MMDELLPYTPAAKPLTDGEGQKSDVSLGKLSPGVKE
jgi:hypothetical protein